MSSGASRIRSGAEGTCLNVFLDLTPAPALFVYTPRAEFSIPAGGSGALDLNARIFAELAPPSWLRKLLASCFLYSSCVVANRVSVDARRSVGQSGDARSRGKGLTLRDRIVADRMLTESRRTLLGDATSAARSRSLALAFSFTRL